MTTEESLIGLAGTAIVAGVVIKALDKSKINLKTPKLKMPKAKAGSKMKW